MKRLISPTGKRKVLGAIHSNAGIEAAYQRRLDRAIEAMARSVLRRLNAVWRTNPPELAQDESTASELRYVLEKLRREWGGKMDDLAQTWGRKYTRDAAAHADRSFAGQLRKAGFTVRFRLTRAANDVMQASISENVSLIRSIPQHYFTQVESLVTEGVRVGNDMSIIARGLERQLGVTKRRAAIIAADQTKKTTAAILRVRQQEVGITEARWLHSGGGRHPRPSHVAMNGKTYEVEKGMYDRDEKKHVWPGQLINCRCVSRAILPGVS